MAVRLTFVGTGDAFGSGGRFQACILLEHDGMKTLLDCGATSLVPLKRARINPNEIATVIVSHLHGDHFGGIPFLVLDGQFARREIGLRVVGPPGTGERLTAAMEVMYPGSATVLRRFGVDVTEVKTGGRVELGALGVVAFEADHASGAPAHIYRVEAGGRTVGYTGDTAWAEGIVAAADGADLLIAEGYSREKRVPFHLDIATLTANRERLNCPKIILTHMGADVLNNPPEGWERAYDGMVVEL